VLTWSAICAQKKTQGFACKLEQCSTTKLKHLTLKCDPFTSLAKPFGAVVDFILERVASNHSAIAG